MTAITTKRRAEKKAKRSHPTSRRVPAGSRPVGPPSPRVRIGTALGGAEPTSRRWWQRGRGRATAVDRDARTRRRVAVTVGTPVVPRRFWAVAVPALALCLLGLVMVLSASSVPNRGSGVSSWYFFGRHAMWLGAGTVALVVGLRLPYRFWIRVGPLVLAFSAVTLALVLVPSPLRHIVNGSKRWLGPGSWTFQPSEVAKLGLIMWLAGLLAVPVEDVRDWRRSLRPALGVLAVLSVLIFLEPDLGTVVLLGVVTTVMLVVAGARLDTLAALSVPATIAVAGLSTYGYRRGRVLAFLDPWKHAHSWGYQTLQSQVGLASGRLFGVGLGNSRAKWGFLPEAHTDFIFAIIGEEFGLVGAVAVIATFLVLFVAGLKASLRCRDRSLMLLGVGISTWIGVQALVNIGVTVGALPNKGITLPYVSYGGSSLMVTMFATGILLQVARRSDDPRPAVAVVPMRLLPGRRSAEAVAPAPRRRPAPASRGAGRGSSTWR